MLAPVVVVNVQSGLSLMPRVRFIVERAHYERGGIKWLREGDMHHHPEWANQAADKLRREGVRVRTRPVVLP